ncbi:divalent metal cation (Fe/Co/Zn/Cd) transporter [Sphingopyxis panaciterrae]|uniref:cation transporter n=1 Tax=Sphingopyxis panaciterrae TaxID=363841 RepID=UPI00141E8223|nr:cation transporter [Sphingopyxis panaciterrae]NIJ36355.1 divalent metal cation (Fe/Co/Zn/Cd) transporter [Sphingopyxis panaciterrae]
MSDPAATHVDSLPPALRETLKRAERLECWNIFWTVTIIVVMGLVLGQSQTMKTAWIEDTLGLVPPIAFLIAARMERKGARSRKFPFGFERVNGLGFFLAAVALAATGALLLWDSALTLIKAEHATVGSVHLFGRDIWLGWLMIGAQVYAMIPPMIIGRKELPLAEELADKLLHTDALMNKANWMTGAAGIAGIIGLGLGWWWADSLAAAAISFDILHDGLKAIRSSTAELVDGTPRALASAEIAEEAEALEAALKQRYPDATIRLRETGRLIRAEVHGCLPPDEPFDAQGHWPGKAERNWRLAQVSFVPPADAVSNDSTEAE